MRLGICLTLLLGSFAAWGGSGVSERALLAVVDLAEVAEKNKWLYRLEGKAAVRRIHRLADEKYGEVIVHEKKKATLTHFLTSLKSLLESPAVSRIDVVIYLHGKNPESETGASVCFVGAACLSMANLAKQIRDLSGQNAWKLRMFYSDACWGKFHMDAWLAAGFRVVNGSRGVDANHSADLRRFLKSWGRGATYEDAVKRANRFWLTPVTDELVRNADSYKMMSGEIEMTIED